ncbi:30S ribosomal protein S5 [Parcubacteria bacterium DG_74_2]|nr:MAG: 30S ribosomal protein S5 [Parcubacteria bacterium DG_74_2]
MPKEEKTKSYKSPNILPSEGRPPEFESKLLDLRRVVRVRTGGKHLRFRALVISGNKTGEIGIGVAKGKDVAEAVEKATRLSKKNLVEIPIINETIPHEILAKYGPAKVLLKPQKKGKGLVAGGVVRVICNLAGIKNISSKILGRTSNKINNARATIKALKELKLSIPLRKRVGETYSVPEKENSKR